MFSNVLLFFAINLFLTKLSHQLSCLDEKGKPVDWFIVYKIPKLETHSNDILRSGYGYTFITDKSIKSNNDWTLSSIAINTKESIFGQTISPVISGIKNSSKGLSYVVYNDQSPDSTTSSSAHSKGLFAVDSNGGFWLTHSVPKFPSLDKDYDYPSNAKHNGQTAICVSLKSEDTKTLNSIAVNLLIMRPKIYGIQITDSLSQKSKQFSDLMNKKWIKNESSIEANIQTKNGLVLTTFSKSNKYPKDMYSGLIATYFKEDLLVQSWRNGAGEKLDSDCIDEYKVQNIDKIGIISVKSVDWNSTEDHSKWVISVDNTGRSYTCISDINRMKSQFKRGGGSLCLHSDEVWKIFKKSIEGVEGCPKKYGNKTTENTPQTTKKHKQTKPTKKSKKRPKSDNFEDNEINVNTSKSFWDKITNSRSDSRFKPLFHSNLLNILYLLTIYVIFRSIDRFIQF